MAQRDRMEMDASGLGEIHALLGRGTSFEGLLSFEGRVRIDGRFKGEILSDGILVIGEGAEVEAHVEVGTLIVRGGTLRGDAIARQLIEIHAEGSVYGDIRAPELDIDKGCVFEGKCTMSPSEEARDRGAAGASSVTSSAELMALAAPLSPGPPAAPEGPRSEGPEGEGPEGES